MLKFILLFTPIYVTFFWALLLHILPGGRNYAKRFMGKFMLTCVFIYIGHFLYFEQLTGILRWYDPIYQLASLLVYPLFYIYFRLLLLEIRFQWKKHLPYLIVPFVAFVVYSIAAYSVPGDTFVMWLYHKGLPSDAPGISFLNILFVVTRIIFILQVALTLFGNLMMIQNFRIRAIQFYSDFWEIRSIRVVILNSLMILCGFASIALSILGRFFFVSEFIGLSIASVIFSLSLFAIGLLGIQQKTINPSLSEANAMPNQTIDECTASNKQALMDKINRLFVRDRIYLNNKLTIQDVAQLVGTNRTYVSSIINQNVGVNFCTYVNNFRMEELERLLKSCPEMTNQNVAEACGFGSIDSLKRAVHNKTGLSVTAWKTKLRKGYDKEPVLDN
jgi:AraC-like DNA-binding protein